MKSLLVPLLMTACLRATATPVCPMGDFYPASHVRDSVDSALADPKPEMVRAHERLWFDFIEVGLTNAPWIYEVAVVREDDGGFHVGLLQPKAAMDDEGPRPGVVDLRELPAPLAERLHRSVIPILARTRYDAALVQSRAHFECMCCSSQIYATVADIDSWFHSLTGEAMPQPWNKDSDAGTVQTLGQALRDYALRHIDAAGLEKPLEQVEAHAKPDKEKER